MTHHHLVYATACGLALLSFAACGGGPGAKEGGQEGRAEGGEVPSKTHGTDPSCRKLPREHPTAPIAELSIDTLTDTISVDPDTVLQPPGVGFLGWKMAGGVDVDSFQVTFMNGDSPLEDTTVRSARGRLVGASVRRDAGCKYYSYTVRIWPAGAAKPVEKDPGSRIIPG